MIAGLASARRAGALLLALAFSSAAFAQGRVSYDWIAFGHLLAQHTEGADDDETLDAQTVRPIVSLTTERVFAFGQLDLAVDDAGDARPGTLANAILDLFVSYRLTDSHSLRLGQFKTPLGMDFNIPGQSLDLAVRGMEHGLVLDRDLGVMLTGEALAAGFSYDVGVFNAPGRSGAADYDESQAGEDFAATLRVRYDRDRWHGEIALGGAEHAGGAGTEDYAVASAALRYLAPSWRIKAEWIEGRDLRGVLGRDESIYYVHGGYNLSPTFELVARHYAGRSVLGSVSTTLGNTYIGITKYFHHSDTVRTRLQANYVLASGDRLDYQGVRGFRDDTILVQLQFYAEK